MPKYVFICASCVVEFERTLKMGTHPTHECPSCSEPAERVWEGTELAFGFADSANATPTNTGVHKEDYPTADHVVGKSANQRWEQVHERDKIKAEARKLGKTHKLIRHTHDNYIDYEPMSPVGGAARKQLTKEAIETVKRQKTQ